MSTACRHILVVYINMLFFYTQFSSMNYTDEWFKYMMRDFKTTGPCTATYNHDHARYVNI